ncbi:MAG: Rrf2 family transcriptional regulator [Actinomycetota bacterium]|nr:Rrf2 family transcriptional regulator [Actinomycetota bacterium]
MRGVLNISEAFSLALHAAVLIAASDGRRETARDMATALGASENHLSKVLQRMVRAGILVSTRGPGGGFSLGRPAREITLMQIYECVEGSFRPVRCLAPLPVCGGGRCVFGGLLERTSGEFGRYLEVMTLEDIGGRPKRGGRNENEKKDRGDRRGKV